MTSQSTHAGVAVEDLAQRIDEILDVKPLGRLVSSYFTEERSSSFAGKDFDTLGDNPPYRVVIDDLLALNLLDVRLGPKAIRPLLNGHADELLLRVPLHVELWKATEDQRQSAQDLYKLFDSLPGIGRTKASKLLARKRPQLVPIRDAVVERVLDLPEGGWWCQLGTVLKNQRRLARVSKLDPGVPGYQPSALRLLDVAIWMVGSGARSARAARKSLGLQQEPLW